MKRVKPPAGPGESDGVIDDTSDELTDITNPNPNAISTDQNMIVPILTAQISSGYRITRRTHWRYLANTTESSMCGGDAALCQITLTATRPTTAIGYILNISNLTLVPCHAIATHEDTAASCIALFARY